MQTEVQRSEPAAGMHRAAEAQPSVAVEQILARGLVPEHSPEVQPQVVAEQTLARGLAPEHSLEARRLVQPLGVPQEEGRAGKRVPKTLRPAETPVQEAAIRWGLAVAVEPQGLERMPAEPRRERRVRTGWSRWTRDSDRVGGSSGVQNIWY